MQQCIEDSLSRYPLQTNLKSYNGNFVIAHKPFEYAAQMVKNLLDDLNDFDEDHVYVMSFVDVYSSTALQLNGNHHYHLFLYNGDYLVDPILCRFFDSIDLYFWFISQLINIPQDTNTIGCIYHKFDMSSNDILMASCKPYIPEAQMVRLGVNMMRSVPIEKLNDIKKRFIN